jgi:hypothetical protein
MPGHVVEEADEHWIPLSWWHVARDSECEHLTGSTKLGVLYGIEQPRVGSSDVRVCKRVRDGIPECVRTCRSKEQDERGCGKGDSSCTQCSNDLLLNSHVANLGDTRKKQLDDPAALSA